MCLTTTLVCVTAEGPGANQEAYAGEPGADQEGAQQELGSNYLANCPQSFETPGKHLPHDQYCTTIGLLYLSHGLQFDIYIKPIAAFTLP